MNKTLLVVAAHPDDEVLGCGGTMSRFASEGDKVFCLILGEGITSRDETRDVGARKTELEKLKNKAKQANEILGVKEIFFESFPDNRFDSVDLLDLVKSVERHVEEIRPQWVFTHYCNDLNIDHRLTFQAAQTACRPLPGSSVEALFSYPVLSSTEWNFESSFRPNFFVNIEHHLDKKIEAMKIYDSELKEWPHPRSIKNIRNVSFSQGASMGSEAMESFVLIWAKI